MIIRERKSYLVLKPELCIGIASSKHYVSNSEEENQQSAISANLPSSSCQPSATFFAFKSSGPMTFAPVYSSLYGLRNRWWNAFPAMMYLWSNERCELLDVRHINIIQTHLTCPSSASFCFVSSVKGVDANIQTEPSFSLIAVERPPTGSRLNKLRGLWE